MAKSKKIKLTLTGSKFGRKVNHAECVRGLGLRRMHQAVMVEDTASNRGMIKKIAYLLEVESV